MYRVLAFVLCALWSATAYAGTVVFTFGGTPVTLTTGAPMDAQLARLLKQENSVRASRIPPAAALTLEQYTRDIFLKELADRKPDADTFEVVDFCTAYNRLTAPQKANIVTLGGNNNPCP